MKFNYALLEHYERIDAAVEELVNLWHLGVDVIDNDMYYKVLEHNGLLNDGFTLDHNEIARQVNRRLR